MTALGGVSTCPSCGGPIVLTVLSGTVLWEHVEPVAGGIKCHTRLFPEPCVKLAGT